MQTTFTWENDPQEKSRICQRILDSLPLWFGIPSANEFYRNDVRSKEFVTIMAGQEVIGFASLNDNNAYVSELNVMGLLPDYHRQGIGEKLIDFIAAHAQAQGKKYLEVKTLAEQRESEEYRRTRLFYSKVGFLPIDVLYNEWGEDNPCLIMLKDLHI